jgi:hypothetical protein
MYVRCFPSSFTATPVLFGEGRLNARSKYQKIGDAHPSRRHGIDDGDGTFDSETVDAGVAAQTPPHSLYMNRDTSKRPKKGSVADFFFGFIYKEETEDDADDDLL